MRLIMRSATKKEIQEVRKSAQLLYEHTAPHSTLRDDFALVNINEFLQNVEEELEKLRGKVSDLYAEKERLAYQQRGEWNEGITYTIDG